MAGKDDNSKGKIRLRHVLQGLLAGLVVGIMVSLLSFFDFNKHLELTTLDLRYRIRPPIPVLPEIGYIEFDDPSLELYGKWPWPRSRHVEMMKVLGFYDARAAGYDVFFLEKEDVVFQPYMLREYLAGKYVPDKKPYLPVLLGKSFRDYDKEFAEAIQKAGNIYLAAFTYDPSDNASTKGLAGILKETKDNRAAFSKQKKRAMDETEKTFLEIAPKWEKRLYKTSDIDVPLPELVRAARGVGFAQPGYDSDSIIRNYIFFRYYDGRTLYSITLKMLSDIMDFKLKDIATRPDGDVILRNARDFRTGQRRDVIIPVDEHFQALLNWAGDFDKTFLHVSFSLLEHYYAYIAAKETAREFPKAGEKDIPLIGKRILMRLMNEKTVGEDEARAIAGNIAVAQAASVSLGKGIPADKIKKKLSTISGGPSGNENADAIADLVSAASTMSGALSDNASMSFDEFMSTPPAAALKAPPERLREVYRNMKWFSGKGRLKDAGPCYFPPAVKVANGDKTVPFSPVDLDGKIFMMGLTGSNTIDLKPTPFENSAPMVAYHVNALNMLMSGNFLHFPPAYYKYAATFLLALLTGLIGSIFSIPVSVAITALFTGGYLFGTYRIWVLKGQWLDWAAPLEGIIFTYLTIIVVQFVRAFLEKRKVRGIFAAMVSPAVLKVMEENPDKFSLTGERKPATTFFSKIDGIGAVTKSIAPDELTQLLGFYLTPNSDIIMNYDGYIDKYEGHVIMADFGVPLDDPDNHWKCAFSTVEQRLDIEAFRYFVLAKYGLKVGVSMGFNYGYVSAGNMGSERKFQYTVMGDPVNVSARFMAANYIYNSLNSITGEDTEPVIRDYVHLRPLDKLLLKGKTRPISIFDITGWKPDAYLKLRGDMPVPGFLETIWGKCPPAKILGYQRFWSMEYARNGHPLAKDISEFFSASLDIALALMLNEWKREIEDCRARTDALMQRSQTVTSVSVQLPPLSETSGYKGSLEKLISVLKTLLESSDDKAVLTEGTEDIRREGKILLNKLELLSFRLQTESVSEEKVLNIVKETKDYIPLVFSGNGSGLEKLDGMIGEARKKYAESVSGFCKALAKKRRQYHEMMSLAGAPDARGLEAMVLFEEGLNLYWERQWDRALDKFRLAGDLMPGEGPILSFRERIETYKINPPGDNWQGEFVQTKK
jgi:CHASE2 domain-containing sensor protein